MNELRGTGMLLAANLLRDKILVPLCVIAFASAAASSAAATAGVYPEERSRLQGVELINSTPALVAMYGRIYDPGSPAAVAVFKLVGMGTALAALFAALMVIRHTRADEELGRYELLASGSIGRFASLAAALLVATIGAVAIGLVTTAGLVATDLATAGSVAFGLSWVVAGFAFAAVGAVAAQLTTSARAARGLAVGTLAVAYLLRAVGDANGKVEPGWPTWLSPIGWAQQIRPYAGDRWLVGLLPLVFGVALIGVALVLIRHRDVGSGLLPQRRGAARASAMLSGPLGLAWRLQRAALLGWLAAFVLMSVVLAQILTRIGDLFGSPAARQLIIAMGGVDEVTQAFLAVELSFVAVFASAYGISATLRLSGEESAARTDLVLSNPVGRVRWAGSHLVIALGGTAMLMLACGLALGLVQLTKTGDAGTFGSNLLAAVVRIPAVWVLVGVTAALYGLARRVGPVAWVVLVATFLTSEIGPLVDLPRGVRDLSPFTYVPNLPGGEVTAGPLLALLAVATVLIAAGLWAVRHRDLAVS